MAMELTKENIYRYRTSISEKVKLTKEKNFILDCIAVDNAASNSFKIKPRVIDVIPPYRPNLDVFLYEFFEKKSVREALKFNKINRLQDITSMQGKTIDCFCHVGQTAVYLKNRNQNGSGHSPYENKGHQYMMADCKPIIGYNGENGYRTNIPSFRSCYSHIP